MTENDWVQIEPNGRHAFDLSLRPVGGRVRFEVRDGDENGVLVTSFLRDNRDSVAGGPGVQPSMFDWYFQAGEVVTARVANLNTTPRTIRAVVVAPLGDATRLLQRLNDHTTNIEQLAADAEMLLAAGGQLPLVRWLRLERGGYEHIGSSVALHEALGLSSKDRLVVHVLAYRAQSGQVVEGQGWTGRPFRHFFVEPLHDLVESAQRARSVGGRPLRLDFGPLTSVNYPIGVVFPPDVFERVVLGFRATLHLQLRSLGA